MDNAEALERFEKYLMRRYVERTTPIHYVSDVRQFQKFCSKPWEQVTEREIAEFVDQSQQSGKGVSTIRRRLAALKKFFAFCGEESGETERANPVRPERQSPKGGRRLPRDVGDEIVEQLWMVLTSPRDQALMAVMWRGGLRIGEVVKLRRGDIQPPTTPGQPVRLRVQGKGQKERSAYLSPDAFAVVERLLQEVPPGEKEAIFRNWRNQPLTKAGLHYILKEWCEKAGVNLSAHQLRHTFARQVTEQGMPITSLAKLLGHEHLATTQLYVEGADPQVRQAYLEAMGRWGEPPSQPFAESTPPFPMEKEAGAESPPAPFYRGESWALDLAESIRRPVLDYLLWRQRDWKESQRERHTRRFLRAYALFWRWLCSQRPDADWSTLTRQEVNDYQEYLTGRGRTTYTLRHYLSSIKALLLWRHAEGESVASSLLSLELPKVGDHLPKALSEEDAQRLERFMLDQLDQKTPEACRDAAWFFVLAHTGIRLSELLDLQAADLDLRGARLRIRQGKGKRDRMVYLSAIAVTALRHYLQHFPRGAQASLFMRTPEMPLLEGWLQARLRNLARSVQVEVSPHRLRHTFATRLVNRSVPITTVQRLLGHDKLSTTQIYVNVADRTVEADYRTAMTQIETSLSLAPLPLSDLFPALATQHVTPVVNNSLVDVSTPAPPLFGAASQILANSM